MAVLPQTGQWIDGVYQIETTDPVVGGITGISNRQATQLGDRTAYLKVLMEAVQLVADGALPASKLTSSPADGSTTKAFSAKGAKALKTLIDTMAIGDVDGLVDELAAKLTATGMTDDYTVGGSNVAASAQAIKLLHELLQPQVVPTGAIFPYAGTVAPDGFLFTNGAILSRSIHSVLWGHAESQGNITSEPDWHAARWGGFSLGDGTSTFRIPKIEDDLIRPFRPSSGRVIGSHQLGTMVSKGVFREANTGLYLLFQEIDGVVHFSIPAGFSQALMPSVGDTTLPRTGARVRQSNITLRHIIKY